MGKKQDPLIAQLVADSLKKQTLMESEALQKAMFSANQLAAAADYIKHHRDYTSYHLLFALRTRALQRYKDLPNSVKASVLVSALQHISYLNDWGLLLPSGSHDGMPVSALLELKEDAIAPLKAVLDDQREARHFGSQASATSIGLRYRRCDFAYRYLSLLLGRSPVFHPNPEVRNKAIARLAEELKTKKK